MRYVKSVSKRLISLVISFAIIIVTVPCLPITSFAATSGTLSEMPDGLEATWSVTNETYAGVVQNTTAGTVTVNAKQKEGCTREQTTTVTMKNNKSLAATLSFDYTLTLSSGTITIDGTSVTAAGSFSKEIAAGASIEISVKSGSTDSNTSLVLKKISFYANVDATTTFVPAENGSFTVDGVKITEQTTKTQNAATFYTLVATAAQGYKFGGWYSVNEEKYLSDNSTLKISVDNDKTITAHFIPEDACQFTVGTKRIVGLAEAISYAQSSSIKTIVLYSSTGTVPAGDYTIPSGYTLLIPDNESETCYMETPATSTNTNTSKVTDAFRTLTLAPGANINVLGSISVGGIMKSANGGSQSTHLGKYGLIKMLPESNIVLQNGAAIYAWGIITGDGTVTAKSGAKVYEWFKRADFRGGTATNSIIGTYTAFPFSQYYVQDIEANLVIEAGATEQVYASFYMQNNTYNTLLNFIGSSGLFNIKSGKISRKYDGSTDRIEYKFDGEAEINSLKVTVIGMAINSADYVLAITNNMKINVSSGSVPVNQDLCLPAGVELTVSNGATVTLSSGKSIYVYDNTEWTSGDFVFGGTGKFKVLPFAYSRTYNRTVANDLPDAKLCVDGTLSLAGNLYTTASGANVTSNGSGKIVMTSAPGKKTTTMQYTQSGSAITPDSIPITSAKLHNADDTYVETASAVAGDSYYYIAGSWVKNPTTATVTVKDTSGNVAKVITIDATNGTSFGEIKSLLTDITPPDENHIICAWKTEGGSYLEDSTLLKTDIVIVPEIELSVIVPEEIPGENLNVIVNNEEKYITGIELTENKVSNLVTGVQGDSTQIIVFKDGKELSSTDFIGTGCVVKCVSKNDHSVVYDTATVLIYGDINGDGAIDAFDAIALDLAKNRLHTLEKSAELAADINNDGVGISTADYAMLVSCVRYETRISQVR